MMFGDVPTLEKFADAKTVVQIEKNLIVYSKWIPTAQSTVSSDKEPRNRERSNKMKAKKRVCDAS